MDILDLMKGFINIIIPVVIMAFIQIIKALLNNRGIKLKGSDTWLWIILALGLPMAILDYGLQGFEAFNIFNLILLSFAYSAASAFIYKLWKVGGKKIGDIFRKDEKKKIPITDLTDRE